MNVLLSIIGLIIALSNRDKNTPTASFKPMLPRWKVRPCDDFGCGNFGASRDNGTRKHKGTDYVANPGEIIRAPGAGKIIREIQPYANDPSFKGIEIESNDVKIQILYVTPITTIPSFFSVGDPIAIVQNLDTKYKGITNHIHVEIENGKYDPEQWF